MKARATRVMALAAILASRGAAAQVSGSWIVDSDGSWSTPANWSSNPLFPDGGGSASFGLFPSYSATRNITLDLPNVTLSSLTFDSEIRYLLNTPGASPANSITLVGAAAINALSSNNGSPSLVPAGHFIGVPLAGSSGLSKSGSGVVTLGAANSYAGGTVISGGVLSTTSGDAAFGAGSITLNSATLRAASTAMNSSRDLLLVGGCTLEAISTITIGGTISS